MIVEQRQHPADQAANLQGGPLDPEQYLPLDLIRSHTKTDDIPAVTDAMLRLYRKAALEAAEKYTGLLIQERKVITEPVALPPGSGGGRRAQNFFWFTASAPFAQPMAYYYGHRNEPAKQVPVIVGQRRAMLPIIIDDFGLGCCNPSAAAVKSRLLYVAGFSCESEIPTAIALGALKYIAHVIENPGDVVRAGSEAGQAKGGIKIGDANNPALASGAIEIWRSCKDDAI